LARLEGVEDPEQKRKIIGNTFINVFKEEAAKIEAGADEEGQARQPKAVLNGSSMAHFTRTS
jgi:hypothetical protein